MKKLYTLIILILTFIPALVSAQNSGKRIWLNAAGNSGMLAVQFDTWLSAALPNWGFMAGAGLIADPSSTGFTIPAGLYYLAGNKGRYLELGAGASFMRFPQRSQDSWFNFEKENFVTPYFHIGYRSQPEGKRRYFRAGLDYFTSDLRLPKILGPRNLVPGISLGWKI